MTQTDVDACSRDGKIAKVSPIKIPVAIKFTLLGHNFELEAQIRKQRYHKLLNVQHKLYLKRLIKSPFTCVKLLEKLLTVMRMTRGVFNVQFVLISLKIMLK